MQSVAEIKEQEDQDQEFVIRLVLEEKYGLHITLAYFRAAATADGQRKLEQVSRDLVQWFGKQVGPCLIGVSAEYELMGKNKDIKAIKCMPVDSPQRTAMQQCYQKYNQLQPWMLQQGLPKRQEPNYHITVKPGTADIVASWHNQFVHGEYVDLKPLGKPSLDKISLAA